MKLIFRTLALSIKMKSKLSRIVLLLSLPIAFLPILLSVKLQNITDGLLILGKEGTGLSYCLSILMQLSVLFLLQIVYRAIESYTREEDCILGAEYILEKTLECKAEIAYPYIENKDKFYERLERIDKFAKERIVESVATIMNLISVFITLVSIVILLGRINMYIVIMILITAFASSYLTYKQNNETFFWDIMWSEKSALANYFYGLCTEKEFIKDLRHYKLYPFFKKKWEQISEEHRVSKKKLMLKHFRNNSAADVIRSVVYLFVLAMTVQKIYQDPAIGIGVFMLVFSLTGQLQNAVTSLLSGTALFLKYIPYMEEYFYVQDLPREVNGKTDALVEQGDIIFRNVSFTYPDCEQEVLHDISIEVKAGEKIAIVGENGSGKSTFISLLCGMLKPSAGKIVVGGCDIETETERIRNSISVVFQNFAHYADTLRNNINISDIKKECNDEEIHGLIKTIHMDEFIERYEEGLDTKLGSLSDHGNDLSGGQWQKIALLRAAYKTNSKIMILDEPTSALDPLAEAQLYEDFSKLTGDKTTLFISHRLGITALVDRVFVFENGRIAEVGTRSELMKKNGIFAAMYKAQAKWYVDNE